MGPEIDRDALREAARRVDWRFLLPHPDLGRVGYAGRVDPQLVGACSLLLGSITPVGEQGPQELFDTLVLGASGAVELAGATASVRPGGWVYVEVDNSLPARLHGRSLAGFTRTLRRLGYEEIETHWHWPSFSACEEMIPLGDPNAVRNTLSRRRRRAPAKTWVGHVLLRAGLIRTLARCTSLVARAPAVSAR